MYQGLILEYLVWLREPITAFGFCLLLDRFDARDISIVHKEAHDCKIQLVFIPRVRTGSYCWLDKMAFRALKAKARSKWAQSHEASPGAICTREFAAGLLPACFQELHNSCILTV
jgi:hypothetical protein